jgi:hypothetical protein
LPVAPGIEGPDVLPQVEALGAGDTIAVKVSWKGLLPPPSDAAPAKGKAKGKVRSNRLIYTAVAA